MKQKPTHINVSIDDLPDECRQIADVIGLDGLLALSAKLGGERIYIPLPERLATAARNRAIRAAFNGRNYHELAIRYGLTVRWIRSIVSEKNSESFDTLKKPAYRQTKMF